MKRKHVEVIEHRIHDSSWIHVLMLLIFAFIFFITGLVFVLTFIAPLVLWPFAICFLIADEAIENLQNNKFSNLRVATPNELIKDDWINAIILRLQFAMNENSFTNHLTISKFLKD